MARAAVGLGLSPAQQAGLLSLLRAVADGERLCEDARARLCEAPEFDPQRAFGQLQGPSGNPRGRVGPAEVHRWLARSPHVATTVSLESLAEALQPYLNSHGDLRYDGFLKMCMPRDPSRSWLKQVALSRSVQAAWPASGSASADVDNRLCQLLEREWNMRSLIAMHHRGSPSLQAMATADVVKFLDAEEGMCAGMGDFLSPEAVRRTLVDRLSALSSAQCDSLMRRLNPSGLCLIAFGELARHVLPNPSWHQALPASGANALREASPAKDHSALSSTRPGTSWAIDASCGLDAARAPSPPPRLREPAGPQACRWAPPARWEVSALPRDQYDPNRDVVFDVRAVPAGARKEASLVRSGSTPLSPLPRDGLHESQRRGCASVTQSWEQSLRRSPDVARDWSPQRRGRPLSAAGLRTPRPETPRRARELGATASYLSPESHGRPGSPPPCRASQWHAAPSSPPRRQASPGRASSLPPGKSLAAAARGARAPAAICKSPPALAPSAGCSALAHRRGGAAPAPAPQLAVAPPSARWPPPASSWANGSLVRRVLKAMALQAHSDARVEEAKLLLPAGLPLEAVFRALDRANKGFVLDTDLLRLLRDFGGSPASGSIAALVRDRQLRHRFDYVAIPGQLSFREIGSLVFPVGSEEHEALCAASSDAEARSILYLLKNSEPCPRCGMRAQRDADAAGCPSVTCPVCGASFRCFAVVGDAPGPEPVGLSPSSSYQLFRLVDTAARAASDVEAERARLAAQPGFDICTLSDAFSSLAGERVSFSIEGLRRALAHHSVHVTEAELGLLWERYAPHGAASVSFPDFVRQLRAGSPY